MVLCRLLLLLNIFVPLFPSPVLLFLHLFVRLYFSFLRSSLSLSLSFFLCFSVSLSLSLSLSLLLRVPLQLKVWSLYIVKRRVGQAGVIEIALNDFQQRHLYVRTKTVKQDQLKLSDLLLLLLLLLLLHSLCHDSAATHKNIRFIRTQILDAFKKRLLPRTKDFKCLDNLSLAVDVIKLFLGDF